MPRRRDDRAPGGADAGGNTRRHARFGAGRQAGRHACVGASPKPAPTAASAPAGENEFAAEAQAKARCPADTVVWANLKTKVYHFSGGKNYGTTKEGAYMCEKDALGQGVRAAKNEKHP